MRKCFAIPLSAVAEIKMRSLHSTQLSQPLHVCASHVGSNFTIIPDHIASNTQIKKLQSVIASLAS